MLKLSCVCRVIITVWFLISGVSFCAYGQELKPKKENGKWGFVDETGNLVIPLKYDEAWNFSEGLAVVKNNNKYGYIDKTDNMVIPLKYEKAGKFTGEVAMVKNNGKFGYINKTGVEILPMEYTSAREAEIYKETAVRVEAERKEIEPPVTAKAEVESAETVKMEADHIAASKAEAERMNAELERENAAQAAATQVRAATVEREKATREAINPNTANNQDVIILKNGQEITAKVTEITLSEIKYKPLVHLDGPIRTLAKIDVFVILYENGTREIIDPVTTNTGGEQTIKSDVEKVLDGVDAAKKGIKLAEDIIDLGKDANKLRKVIKK